MVCPFPSPSHLSFVFSYLLSIIGISAPTKVVHRNAETDFHHVTIPLSSNAFHSNFILSRVRVVLTHSAFAYFIKKWKNRSIRVKTIILRSPSLSLSLLFSGRQRIWDISLVIGHINDRK